MRTVSSHSELTPNHVPGSEMPTLQQLAGAHDEHGRPLPFGLQASGELVLVLHDPQVLTCWQRIDLSAQLAPGHDVHAKMFGLVQKPDGSLRLAVIAYPGAAMSSSSRPRARAGRGAATFSGVI